MQFGPHVLTHATRLLVVLVIASQAAGAQLLFSDDFESGLARWTIHGTAGVIVAPSADRARGNVMILRPNGDVHALINGSDNWRAYRVDGDAMFPTARDAYLGFVYNFQRRGARMDFGNIYVKGNGSYIQANPHRDYNVGRTLYPEAVVPLRGADSVRTGEWFRFRVEVIGRECHVYVGDMEQPKMIFSDFELERGAFGFQPRSVGDSVLVDNVTAVVISEFTYKRGATRPAADTSLLRNWEVLGPFSETRDDVARNPRGHSWQRFMPDARGAVVTARVVDMHGPNGVAYFRVRITSPTRRRADLHLSTIDDMAIWVNGRFHWFLDRGTYAWPDFWHNAAHAGQRVPLDLAAGENDVVIRVRGGVYATGGFFARLEDPRPRR